jgi:hypothetical protein
MKNLEVNSLGLMELDAREMDKIEGGYAPGDVVTDANGLMWRCLIKFEDGSTYWQCLGSYAA